jgi:sec-independent protein translocase protein TatB
MHMSFSEIILILIVALLVIKPEKLPDAARTLGSWIKWLRTTNEKIKQEMEKPLDLFSHDKLTKQLREPEKQKDEMGA